MTSGLSPLHDFEGKEPAFDPIARAHEVRAVAAASAEDIDRDAGFPLDEIRLLDRVGLLRAPLPRSMGGDALGTGEPKTLREVLRILGRGSLTLGRLYEGHVNALSLVGRYGSAANMRLMAKEVDAGYPTGVWMAGEPLRLERSQGGLVLEGRKVLCSGAGHCRRPLVAAEFEGGSIMLIPRLAEAERVDTAGWTAHGMRATATGTVDFSGLSIREDEIVGAANDYLRSPFFRGGAWRVLAVQLGGLEALLDHYKAQLGESPHRDHPLQLSRYGAAAIAFETARLWVGQACSVAEDPFDHAEAVDAYVDLARNAFEDAALRVVSLAQKAIGLKAFLRPNPMERVIRDLTTYLRQPALDMSLMSGAAFYLRQAPSGPT